MEKTIRHAIWESYRVFQSPWFLIHLAQAAWSQLDKSEKCGDWVWMAGLKRTQIPSCSISSFENRLTQSWESTCPRSHEGWGTSPGLGPSLLYSRLLCLDHRDFVQQQYREPATLNSESQRPVSSCRRWSPFCVYGMSNPGILAAWAVRIFNSK